MQSTAATVEEYIESLPADRQEAISCIRNSIIDNLPEGYEEQMNYGMIGYVVPHSRYPAGYHCNPDQPLPFLSLASQKNYISVYHSGIYADQHLLDWFREKYNKLGIGKPDIGKSCIRFKKIDQIPVGLIGELASQISVDEWIKMYENSVKR
jgi:hypothetical protein